MPDRRLKPTPRWNIADFMNPKNPIRVLSVDDSAFFRKVLGEIFSKRDEIAWLGCANDPYDARDRLLAEKVDVMTLDLEMPRMGGLTFLNLIMERKPMPVIVLSSEAPPGSPKAIEALSAGAFAVMEKPKTHAEKKSFAQKLISGIKVAAATPARISPLRKAPTPVRVPALTAYDSRQIIALGASTGGTQALEEILAALPADLPGIVVVQHIPAHFSASFAARLHDACAMEVREARDGDTVSSGLALIAPGNRHMEVRRARGHYRVRLHDGPPVEHQRPSVDVLFRSLAECAGAHTVAALLTGMGRDGAAGMKQLHNLHAHTIAQDAGSSVVYGMARQAVELKAIDAIVPLENIAGEILKALEKSSTKNRAKSYA